MEPIQRTLSKLEEHLPLIASEDAEEYILTREEEAIIKEHEVTQAKKHMAWKMAQTGMQEGDILQKLSAIDWEKEIDFKASFLRANSTKHYDRWQKEQRDSEVKAAVQRMEELQKEWTAKRFFNLMSWTSLNAFGKKLIVNDNNSRLITTLCFFFSKDERFESQLGLNLNKGIMIRGKSGLGKTHLVRCIEQNPLRPVKVLSMLEVTERLKEEGEYKVSMEAAKVLYLDDVGTEEASVMHYGNKINWFKDFLEMVYLKNVPFNSLMLSTNINSQGIEDRYGYRVRSRLREMFNVIDVDGEDMRG